jgi:two-component sensor histidine kinase
MGLRVYEWNSAPVLGANGEYQGFQSTGRDITEQKENETRITELLKERDLLLHEIHHRVKNDLNFVYSLLSLQSDSTESKKARRALTEAGDRIRVIMRVYDLLIHRASKGTVSIKAVDRVVSKYGNLRRRHVNGTCLHVDRRSRRIGPTVYRSRYHRQRTRHERDEIRFTGQDSSTATDTSQGRIGVEIEETNESSTLSICIRDDGTGFPPEIVEGDHRGFGLTVVDSLVSQYNGRLTLQNDGGAVVEASISLESR